MGTNEKIREARRLIAEADCVLIGAGAGLSTAAGLQYAGEQFERDFRPFIRRYGFTDLYTSGFYPFETEEERWAYWAKHVEVARYRPEALPLYRELLALVEGKDYFVVTTNVDAQFRKAGFPTERLFEVQGDYGLSQCAHGCHETLYDNESLIRRMVAATDDCRIPSRLVPRCPRCGGKMDIHVRKDAFFVEDEAWRAAHNRYRSFVEKLSTRRHVVLLELGVGFNTPTIIRYPFELMADARENFTLIRINRTETEPTFIRSRKNLLLLPIDATSLVEPAISRAV